MADSIVREAMRETAPLRAEEPVDAAVQRLVEENLPALPVVDERGRYVGLFGERELMKAIFPGYVDTLGSARMVSRSVDDTIERRIHAAEDPVAKYVTKDEILVEDDFSDTELAEIFLHHRVLVIPIATEGRVHALVTRRDFFLGLVNRAEEIKESADN